MTQSYLFKSALDFQTKLLDHTWVGDFPASHWSKRFEVPDIERT